MGAYQVRTALNLSEAGQVLAPDRGLTSSIHEYTAHTLILSTPSDPFGEITQEKNLVNLPGRIESRMVGTSDPQGRIAAYVGSELCWHHVDLLPILADSTCSQHMYERVDQTRPSQARL